MALETGGTMTADEYNQRQVDMGYMTAGDIVPLLVEGAEAYQAAHGLEPDGKIGPKTLAVLRSPVSTGRVWPLAQMSGGRDPIITSAFRTSARPTHDGVDLMFAVDLDADSWSYKSRYTCKGPVRAAAAGVVSFIGEKANGERLWIDHADGLRTGYFHLANVMVEVGDEVKAGEPIARLCRDQKKVWPFHLHFEVSPVGAYRPQDPAQWLESAGVLP